MSPRIDLHTHSHVSDGTQSPAELVRAGAEAGLDVLALTDHDTAAGWDEARDEAVRLGLTWVPGMEISTRHHGGSVHLLAYLLDPTLPELVAELDRVLSGRNDRLPRILERLAALGIELSVEDVVAGSTDAAATGRPHIADALVARGLVADREEAFARYLNPGRPAYVERYAAELAPMIDLVDRAGGVSVLAHPWGRGGDRRMTPERIAELAEAGLTGIEVDHQEHDPGERDRLRRLADELGLVRTGSSDHHGTGKVDHELGCHTTDPEQFDRLLARAGERAAASGRAVPTVAWGTYAR